MKFFIYLIKIIASRWLQVIFLFSFNLIKWTYTLENWKVHINNPEINK